MGSQRKLWEGPLLRPDQYESVDDAWRSALRALKQSGEWIDNRRAGMAEPVRVQIPSRRNVHGRSHERGFILIMQRQVPFQGPKVKHRRERYQGLADHGF